MATKTQTPQPCRNIEFQLNANTFVRPGYVFKGWNTNWNATEIQYRDNDRVTLANDIDLYAIWSINRYTLALSASPSEGGNVSGGGEFDYGTVQTISASPSPGYEFVSWSDGGEQTHTVTIDSNKTLVATFEENTYIPGFRSGPLITRQLGTYETRTGFANAVLQAEENDTDKVWWAAYDKDGNSLMVPGSSGMCKFFRVHITPSRNIIIKFKSNLIDDVVMSTYINGESRIYSDYIEHYDCRGIFGSYTDDSNILHHSLIEYEIYVNGNKATHNDYYAHTLNANQENVIEYRFVQNIVGNYNSGSSIPNTTSYYNGIGWSSSKKLDYSGDLRNNVMAVVGEDLQRITNRTGSECNCRGTEIIVSSISRP